MVRPRPRRAYRAPLLTRVVRVVAPLALVGLGTAGVLAVTMPGDDEQTAVPAPVSSTAVHVAGSTPTLRQRPVSRDVVRTTPTPSASATPPTPRPRSAPPSKSPSTTTSAVTPATVTEQLGGAASAAALPPEVAAPDVTGTMYATDDLSIRVAAKKKSDVVSVVDPGTKLAVTDTVRDGFRYVSYGGEGRWVTDSYLSEEKPAAETGGPTMTPCTLGSAMESGLTKDAILVHRTVCARYPQVTAFGGLRGGEGFHATGQAVDCMISDSDVGWKIANWVRANAKRLGVSQVIYSRHIWTVQRGSEGWRSMSDRGSRTANHYDHVHVSVYGNRATG